MEEAMKRNNFLDVMKGVCILFVVITHYAWKDQERLDYLFPFWISMAVPVFMIISGYVNAKSYQKNHIVHISEAYSFGFVWKKIVRYTIPFLMIYIAELVCLAWNNRRFTAEDSIRMLLTGGLGKGSYYYPIMIQFIFLFPIIYFIIQKYRSKGLFLCGIMNGLYELLRWAYDIDGDAYRLLVFRYLLVIAAGCYIADENAKIRVKESLLCMLVGIIYIIRVCYMKCDPVIIEYWRKTSFVACLMIIPVAMYLIKNCKIRCKFLELLGKASFNICLVQMMYYEFFAEIVYASVERREVELLINIVSTVTVGLLFYFVESHLTNRIIERMSSGMEGWHHLVDSHKKEICYKQRV